MNKPTNKPTPENGCPKCDWTGFYVLDVPREHPQFGQAVPCACEQLRRRRVAWERAQRYSDMTPELRDGMTFDTWDQRRYPGAFRCMRDFAQHPHRGWVVLIGETGAGKTHLMVAAAQALLAQDIPALYINAPDLLAHLRDNFDTPGRRGLRLEYLRDVPVLLLDDYGAESQTKWSDEQFYRMLSYRYQQRLPTVISSNDLLDTWELRLASRAQDRAHSILHEMLDDDYRTSAARAARKGR